MGFAVNNNQVAVAHAAVTLTLDLKRAAAARQIWCVPAGHGKSRIIAAIMLMLRQAGQTARHKFVVAFSDRRLHDFDMATIRAVAEQHNIAVKGVHPGLGGSISLAPGTVVLIDEVDHLLIDQQVALFQPTRAANGRQGAAAAKAKAKQT